MVKNISHCGGCTKGSCNGCSNYIQGKAVQTTTAQIVTAELIKAGGIFILFGILFIII